MQFFVTVIALMSILLNNFLTRQANLIDIFMLSVVFRGEKPLQSLTADI